MAPAYSTTKRRRRSHKSGGSSRRRTALRWALAVGAFGALSGIFVHGLFDAAMWGTRVAFLFWLLVALIGLLDLRAQARKRQQQQAAEQVQPEIEPALQAAW